MAPRPLPPAPSPSPPRDSNDPFLAQSRDIPLTARDRQEGYDLDLVHSQPRGSSISTPSTTLPLTQARSSSEKPPPPPLPPGYFGQPSSGPILPTSTSANLVPRSSSYSDPSILSSTTSPPDPASRIAYTSVATSANGGEANRVRAGTGGTGTGASAEPLVDGRGEKDATVTPTWVGGGSRRKKAWYLRPRAIATLAALIIIILALSIGLGVGLTRRDKKSDLAAVESPYGTVIPSSLGDITTTLLRSSTTTPPTVSAVSTVARSTSSVAPVAASTSASSSAAFPTASGNSTISAIVSGASVTSGSQPYLSGNDSVKATTGNLPIPVDSETTIGSVVFSSVSIH